MKRFAYKKPRDLAQAITACGEGGVPKAGGTDVLLLFKERIEEPQTLVDLSELRGLDRIELLGDSLRIGALTKLADLEHHAEVVAHGTALAIAAGEAATPQIRNMATLAGNLCQRPRCWYFRSPDFSCAKKGGTGCPALEGENQYHAILGYGACAAVQPSNLAPALVALNALVEVRGKDGSAEIRCEHLYDVASPTKETVLEAGELITGVSIPIGGKSSYLEVREKASFDWPLAAVAVVRRGERVRVVFGAVSPKPWRSDALDDLVSRGDLSAAKDLIRDEVKPLANNGYKVQLLTVLLGRALRAVR